MSEPVPLRCSVFDTATKAQCQDPGVVAHYVMTYPIGFIPREQHPGALMLCQRHNLPLGAADE